MVCGDCEIQEVSHLFPPLTYNRLNVQVNIAIVSYNNRHVGTSLLKLRGQQQQSPWDHF